MPLHAVTDRYGEEGLRARFLLEIGRFDPPQRRQLTAALGLATDLHRHDRRIREPYLNHLLRVATRIISHYEILDSDLTVAALLHDAVEDHAPELAGVPGSAPRTDEVVQAAFAALAEQFGARSAGLVEAVTNPRYDPERDPDDQYREHVAASLDRNPWARVLKLSDFTDNGVERSTPHGQRHAVRPTSTGPWFPSCGSS